MFEKVAQFFQQRKTEVRIQPEIQIDYHAYAPDDVKVALKDQWEQLLKEIEKNPEMVKSRAWLSWGNGSNRKEEIVVVIDNVLIKLEGPDYSNPNYRPSGEPPRISPQEQANENLDGFISSSRILWDITHCSDRKFDALVEYIKATRSARTQ